VLVVVVVVGMVGVVLVVVLIPAQVHPLALVRVLALDFPDGKPAEYDGGNYYIRDGIVIIPKNAVIPDGTWI
jgi:hypothetical protein